MKSTTSTLVSLLATLSLLAVACGGGDADDDAQAAIGTSAEVAESDQPDATTVEDAAAAEPDSSTQSARVTLSTGEVFELTPTSCENQTTDPNSLLNDDFVDLSGRNDDGFRFQVLNARSAEQEPAAVQVELSGNRDENDVNPAISYIAAPGVIEATTITIDGRRVTGESTIDARFSEEKPFGEEVVATFEFNC